MDDATALADGEVLPDEQKTTPVGFLARAAGWFSQQGITCRAMECKPVRNRLSTPRTNGKAERSGHR